VPTRDDVVFLLDVDNTLLDNDRFADDLGDRIERGLGVAQRERYWTLFAKWRDELGYADYLSSLQSLRAGLDDNPDLLQISAFVLEYPFARRLYPHALEAITHLKSLGRTAVLSDGDIVFQPRKIQRSGIWDAVDGNVMIYVHKERMLDDMRARFPAFHYVMVDDKPNLLAAMKTVLGPRLTTVFVRQGHYARDAQKTTIEPPPDMTIDRIGDLLTRELTEFLPDGGDLP
jgi:FMN phosphatase YigB (HAD superfamily)